MRAAVLSARSWVQRAMKPVKRAIRPIALMVVTGAAIPGLGVAGADPAASPLGEAAVRVTAEIGFDVQFVQLADQNVPTKTDSHSENTDSTKDGIREASHVIHTSVVTVTIGHVVADAQVSVTTTRTNVASGTAVDKKTSLATAHFDINTCPDPNGIATGHVKVWMQAETTRPGDWSAGGVSEAEGPIRVVDGDDAHLLRTDMDLRMSSDIHGYDPADGKTPFESSLSGSLPISMSANLSTVVGETLSNPTGTGDIGKYHPEQWMGISQLELMNVANDVAKAAEEFWRSGKCITLKPSEKSRSVKPREHITVTVEAVHKIDGEMVKAPIRGDLKGVGSLEPDAKAIEPPASFDYVAGEQKGDEGSIAFLQVGKRGIGKETVKYIVDCVDLEVSYSGTNHFSGGGKTVVTEIGLPPTHLKCTDDGTYQGQGQMTVKGTSAAQMNAGGVDNECHGAFEHQYAVALTAEIDDADPTQVRIAIRGAGDHTTIGISEIAETDTVDCVVKAWIMGHLVVRKKQQPYWFPDGIDMWQRMVGIAAVTLDKPLTVTKSIGQGGASDETSTRISVSGTKR